MSSYQPTVFTISTLTRHIKDLMEDDLTLRSVWVRGEISNFTHHTSGHMYFTLKDSGARLRAVMFRGNNHTLRFKPTEGTKVLALGSISVYEKSGDYQFYVEVMEPEGLGSLYAAFQQLKDKLEKEGLFAPEKKKRIPPLPKKIAVLTSPTGAAVRDIITISQRRSSGVKLLIIPTIVQGESAPASIVEGLKTANEIDDIDIIILGRGGGSIEELWAFNEETVARAIADSRIPVISAVGHETDFTIADFVADLRAPTPSGAAELAVPDIISLRSQLTSLTERLAPALRARVDSGRQRLAVLTNTAPFNRPKASLDLRRQEVDHLVTDLYDAVTSKVNMKKMEFAGLIAKLDAMSPLSVLSRGYSICTGSEGTVIRDASQVNKGDRLRIRLYKGTALCDVVETETQAHPDLLPASLKQKGV
jgi:exodeoxyribonuclease VII large subunit